MSHVSPEMRECIRECTNCHDVCLSLIGHCLEKGGEHAQPDHVGLLQDCAQICQTSADFMLRGSQYHHQTCGVCAEVCDACAADCERIGGDDAEMRRCAEACRRCAESCRRMAGVMAH
jgi:hypothetical protein